MALRKISATQADTQVQRLEQIISIKQPICAPLPPPTVCNYAPMVDCTEHTFHKKLERGERGRDIMHPPNAQKCISYTTKR